MDNRINLPCGIYMIQDYDQLNDSGQRQYPIKFLNQIGHQMTGSEVAQRKVGGNEFHSGIVRGKNEDDR